MSWRVLLSLAALALLLLAEPAAAQSLTLDLGEEGSTTARILQLVVLLTVLSLAPSILVMVTSFTRIVVVLSLLRSALGLQQTPPNSVLIGLALFLTAFIMAPILEEAYDAGIKPLIAEEIQEEQAYERTLKPIHGFMLGHVREKDLELFLGIAEVPEETKPEDFPLRAVIPAFMISELRRAFEIGFLLFVPFIVIDMVVASILMSMGMLMLPPITISLPFKLIFFVLVDGWYMVVGSLVRGFGGG
ncbi:MAG: flagellar type III secretion system pore protein FliP [Alphaproteobacteria bacterium]|nr:flagellar type III secretion system pore protein FliP [Alphaproteobacteria bacterium]